MKKFLLTAVLAFTAALVFAQERIAVFPFEDRENVFTSDEAAMFYRTFYNEFTNRSAGRFSVVPQSEMQGVLNCTQILSMTISRLDNNIHITIFLYTYPELIWLGGTILGVSDKNELFSKIPELVQGIQNTIAGGTTGNTTNIPANFVQIQGGTFNMGSPSNEPQRNDNEGPQRQVTVNSFYMSRHEVTQKEYQEIMGTNPSYPIGDNLPVEMVNWYDAVEYCNRRSEREGLTPAYTINGINVTWNRSANGYRLPTEAEWEYACRAGTQTPYNTGISIRDNTGWYSDNSGNTVHPVGQKPANAWGLYDMHGNVWEWCWDWYGNYLSGAQTDPQGAVSGSGRVVRGGSWDDIGHQLRSAYRDDHMPSGGYLRGGFRLVRNAQ